MALKVVGTELSEEAEIVRGGLADIEAYVVVGSDTQIATRFADPFPAFVAGVKVASLRPRTVIDDPDRPIRRKSQHPFSR
jgi:hypothetical protein